MRTFWLSFASEETGKNLGCCLVDLTAAEIIAMKAEIAVRFPHALPGAELVGAAVRKAREFGQNPGGSVACHELPKQVMDSPEFQTAPRLKLMQKPELIERGLIATGTKH